MRVLLHVLYVNAGPCLLCMFKYRTGGAAITVKFICSLSQGLRRSLTEDRVRRKGANYITAVQALVTP